MKTSKYVAVIVTQGNYGYGWEDECSTLDPQEAREDLRAYRVNSPYPSRNIRRRVLREKYEKGEF